ncbi:addiction module toxin, Txe/YoeB family [Caldicellulosiruptor hydrothermalis 108]|uniref:Endoribonuclease YoeB n=1 Tax=Caldicellulosiruptor hydrothermalis (strain DSM 18901 / VKM B-2411 / 108) TaxID=632292 RepID=E4Q7W0_CALH1|nr:Txe/YoeB family addiction module toxin [Caldicellulosiruptor hydrothermalis]ADQ07878.1 addiction module toxin, Txe/YoeB family [Caldicellulosiruptor hydrothermalis 108]
MGYKLKFSKQVLKDAKKLEACGLDKKAKEILKILKQSPYQNLPPYEKLKGDLEGKLSRRINIQYRIIYQVLEEEKIVKIYRM